MPKNLEIPLLELQKHASDIKWIERWFSAGLPFGSWSITKSTLCCNYAGLWWGHTRSTAYSFGLLMEGKMYLFWKAQNERWTDWYLEWEGCTMRRHCIGCMYVQEHNRSRSRPSGSEPAPPTMAICLAVPFTSNIITSRDSLHDQKSTHVLWMNWLSLQSCNGKRISKVHCLRVKIFFFIWVYVLLRPGLSSQEGIFSSFMPFCIVYKFIHRPWRSITWLIFSVPELFLTDCSPKLSISWSFKNAYIPSPA